MVLMKLISDSQNAFISGRNILDGVVVVNEAIDLAKRTKRHGLILKVDFQKAYDTVNWNHLDYMLRRMGFSDKWRGWMRECYSSNSISILVNGSPTEEFVAQKGIKQGDPLAPFLFLVAAEGLAGLVRKGEESGHLKGFEINEELSISLLQFADDTIFLCDGKERSVRCLKAILRSFEMVSGLKVNFAKSNVVGLNMEERSVIGVSNFLACKVGSIPFKFLGVPVGANPRRASTWQPIIDNIKARLSHWRSMKLSIGGRVTLINSVLSSLPLYLFSMYKAPKKVIVEIQKLQRRFLWGGEDDKRKMAWVSWDWICKPKDKGGLGVKDLNAFNIALISKWRWRLLNENEHPLWKRILSIRYGTSRPWFGEGLHQNNMKKTSLWWRDLALIGEDYGLGADWFKRVVKRKLGNGETISFWSDVWIGTTPLAEIFPSLFEACVAKEARVSEMGVWNQNGWCWVENWAVAAPQIVAESAAELTSILQGIQPAREVVDKWIWLVDSTKGFTVKSCYNWIVEQQFFVQGRDDNLMEEYKALWKNDLPSKILIFSWRLLLNKLPTRDQLHSRGILSLNNDLSCAFCSRELESTDHIFWRCDLAETVWRNVLSWMGVDIDFSGGLIGSFREFKAMFKGKSSKRIKHLIWGATMWNLWLARNNVIFKGKAANVNAIVVSIKFTSWGWFIARRGRHSGLAFSDWFTSPMGCLSSL